MQHELPRMAQSRIGQWQPLDHPDWFTPRPRRPVSPYTYAIEQRRLEVAAYGAIVVQ